MQGETLMTAVGSIARGPVLTFTASGVALASFTIATAPRVFDAATGRSRDGERLFLRCLLSGEVAETAAAKLSHGTRVIAHGRLQQRAHHMPEDDVHGGFEMFIDEIGVSMTQAVRHATATCGNAALMQ